MASVKGQPGPPTRHVMESKGADTDLFHFYVSEYSTNYGDGKFKPRAGAHSGAGYTSNRRPMRNYNSGLDELDNPMLGHMISSGNYLTSQRDHFRPFRDATGTEPLPHSTHQVDSGYTEDKALAGIPLQKQVNSVHFDKINSGNLDDMILPKHKPRLHKIQAKDPTENQNFDHGAAYMTSETRSKFLGTQRDPEDVKNHLKVGKKLDTGYTSNVPPLEPILFNPGATFSNETPGEVTDRPTEVSITKTEFGWPKPVLKGDEALPVRIAPGSERYTGFTREVAPAPKFIGYANVDQVPDRVQKDIKKKDPMEFINILQPHNHTSVTKEIFKNPVGVPEDFAHSQKIGNLSVGNIETSGFTTNNDQHIMTADDAGRFITHNQVNYWDMNPVGKFREGHCRGGVQDQLDNAFIRSTKVHDYGPKIDNTEMIRKLDPYQAKSMKSRDPFVERETHIHDHKLHKLPC